MEREQWCRRVPKTGAEQVRRQLIAEGILDTTLRPASDGEDILFPVTEHGEGDILWQCRELPVRAPLPRHELVGGIAIMQDEDVEEARRLLASRPSLHTVLGGESPVLGTYRTRTYRVLAGVATTRTIVTEYGLRLAVDLEEAYFSPRLANERNRIAALMHPGERVLDMFAGVGPFAIACAPNASIVYACDLNPGAIRLMDENIRMNRRTNVIPVLADACHLPGILPHASFDRIIMNLPMDPAPFLDAAFTLARDGATIHLYALQEGEGALLPALAARTLGDIREHEVRSYSPTQHHAVYDIDVLR
ncbi:methyltransferase [Methanomicrobiaceae archaeon CYW5]|uniref:class I SAM-dependent methyltransferase n=1 Tax=Methanovulcanius yangii TaxID=1789227 RepID=UPI0029CA4CFD|nr:50S ribosomal protein L11 methyltransferase [Methanovulcanius yangii]MBT8508900.1 methyltransferase [Methanovulcanius yangii]